MKKQTTLLSKEEFLNELKKTYFEKHIIQKPHKPVVVKQFEDFLLDELYKQYMEKNTKLNY